jgi:hypothetical protein
LIPPPGAIVVAIELADKRRAEANGQLGAAWLATLAESRVSTKPIGAARLPGDANRDPAADSATLGPAEPATAGPLPAQRRAVALQRLVATKLRPQLEQMCSDSGRSGTAPTGGWRCEWHPLLRKTLLAIVVENGLPQTQTR